MPQKRGYSKHLKILLKIYFNNIVKRYKGITITPIKISETTDHLKNVTKKYLMAK